MKIAFLYKYFPNIGGVERVISILANQFVKMGHTVTIYSFNALLDKPCYPLKDSIKIKTLTDSMKIDTYRNAIYLINEFYNNEYDILFNHDSVSDTMNLIRNIKNHIKAKVITLHHGQIYLSYSSIKSISHKFKYNNPRRITLLYFVYDRIKKYIHHKNNIKISDKYILLSDVFKQDVLNSHNRNKINRIYNPLSYNGFMEPKDLSKKDNKVIMVGRLSEIDKRISYGLKIWSAIESSKTYDNWSMDIIGDGPDKMLYENLIQSMNLKRVRLIGYDDPTKYYKQAKILFLTSAFEGMPLVIMEASQFGCVPIVMNSFGSLSELIEHNKNGKIVTNNDMEEFTSATKELMDKDSQLHSLAENAIVNSTRFLPDAIAQQWICLFDNVLKQNYN